MESTFYVVYDTSTGEIKSFFTSRPETYDDQYKFYVKPGYGVVEDIDTPDPFTEYYPGGVRTKRPLLTDIASWDKICVEPNGTEAATFGSGLPNPTYLSVYPNEYNGVETIEGTCTDGAASITFNKTGLYHVRASAWPYQDYDELIGANIYPPRTQKYVFTGYDAIIPDIAGRTRYYLTGYSGSTSDHNINQSLKEYIFTSYTPVFTNRVVVGLSDYYFMGWTGNASKQQVIPTSGSYSKSTYAADINNSIHLSDVGEYVGTYNEGIAKASLLVADFAEYAATYHEAYTPSKITDTTTGTYVLTGYVEETTIEGEMGSYIFTSYPSIEGD